MRRFIVLILSMVSFASLTNARNLTKEVYDSIFNMAVKEEIWIQEIYPPYEESVIKADSLQYYTTPLEKHFVIYVYMEDESTFYLEQFNYNIGIYRIFETAGKRFLPYYVMFQDNRYWIYKRIDKKMKKRFKKILKAAKVSEEKEKIILETLQKHIEWQAFPR